MYRLWQLKAYALGETSQEPVVVVEKDPVYAQLEASDVPVSFADCRICPDPCDEDHEAYPSRLEVDMDSNMLGSVKPYRRQVVISTGKSDWEREVTEAKGTLAAYLLEVQNANSPAKAAKPAKAKKPPVDDTPKPQDDSPKPPNPPAGIFRSAESSKISILNGSHLSICDDDDQDTILVFPDYTLITGIRQSIEGAQELWSLAVDPKVGRVGPAGIDARPEGIETWIIPYSCVILLCSHKRRDNRCAITAPKLEAAFTRSLERKGWDVHTQIEHPSFSGAPLEKLTGTPSEKEEHVLQTLKTLPSSKRALLLKSSHIGGHKYVGNCIIYTPQGSGVWYGRVSTHEVESIVDNTILEGKVLPPLLRAGLNVSRPGCSTLNDW